jgi:hypothetical protein
MSDGREVLPFKPRPPEPVHDTSYEVALDDAVAGTVVPVDPPPVPAGRRDIVPANWRTRQGRRIEIERHRAALTHRAGFHGLRLPVYVAQVAFWSQVGAVKLLFRWLHWWLFPVPLDVHNDARQEGYKGWMSTFRIHLRMTKTRAWISLAVGLPVLTVLLLMWFYAPWWAWIPLAAAVLPLLAHHGRPKDRPIMRSATVTPRFRKLNADIVLRAYYRAKLGDEDKPHMQVMFGSPMAREAEGSGVDVDLPYGLGLSDAIKAKDALASGLDVQVSQVFLHRDPTSIRRHHLWVADRDPLAVPVGRTPLLTCRATDIWKPAPFGLDERGQLVTVPLMWNSVLVSALPRAGKTFSARLLALFCALDPYVRLSVFDAKGSPDWRKFSLVADACAFGLTPTKDGLPPEILRDTLLEIKDDVQDRYTRLSGLPTDICPEGKLTRKIARDPRFGMPIRVVVLEEFQEYYDLGEISKQIAALLVFLVKVAPGAGVILVGSTQRPSGIGSGELARQFTNFRDNFAVRFGLRTSSWQVSELCLGAGAYSEGLDTSTLLPQYKGVGILRGATDASPTVRTYLADGQDAERILTAARALREQAGTLSGYAAGMTVDKPVRDVLGDVLSVMGDRPGLHWQPLAEKLAARFPDRYADATGDSLSADLRALGVPSVPVKVMGQTLRGCRREDVSRAAAG